MNEVIDLQFSGYYKSLTNKAALDFLKYVDPATSDELMMVIEAMIHERERFHDRYLKLKGKYGN